MLRKILAAATAVVLIMAFSLAAMEPSDAAAKRKRAAKPAPVTAASCAVDILFLPITLGLKKRIC